MEPKKPISHFIAGLIISAVLIIYSLMLQFTNNQQNNALVWLSYCFLIGGLIIFISLYGKAMDHQVTFGNLFGYGFKTTAFIALIMIAFTVIYFSLFPDVKAKMFEIARQKMEERNMPDDQIEKGLEVWKKMFWVFAIGGIILMYAIFGAIGSLIGAAVTKKKPVNPLDQMNM